MKLFLCDSLEATLADFRAQADETLGELVRGEVYQVEARGGSEATRRALREQGESAAWRKPPHVLLVHARSVGGAAGETEAWFAALAGYDLGILYSEAWDGDAPAVSTLVPGRWKVGTRLLRGRFRSLLEAFRRVPPGTTVEPVHLEHGAWESILAEPIMELLGLLVPAGLLEGWHATAEREQRVGEVTERLVGLVREAGASGTHGGWSRCRGELGRVGTHASARSQADALAVIAEECLGVGGPLGLEGRRERYRAFREDLLRLVTLPAVPPAEGP